MGIASPSKRLEAIPPYKFQELEQQIADKRAAGIDVISLGIGDPDEPTYPHVVEAMKEQQKHLFELGTAEENLPKTNVLPPTR